MCQDTLIEYNGCKCKIMVHEICYDHIQHTLQQQDDRPCSKLSPGCYVEKFLNTDCFLEEGVVCEDGRIFHHGSYRIRDCYEFERDPAGGYQKPQKWERHNEQWERSHKKEARERDGNDDKMDEDTHVGGRNSGDDDILSGENGPFSNASIYKRWRANNKPRVKLPKAIEKELPAADRKTINHLLETPIFDDEPLIQVQATDTATLCAPTPKRSSSVPPTSTSSSTLEFSTDDPRSRKRINSRDDSHYSHGIHRADTYRPHTPRFNFNPPFAGKHTYIAGQKRRRGDGLGSHVGSHMGSRSTRGAYMSGNGNDDDKTKSRADYYRPRHPTTPPDVNTTFYAGTQEDKDAYAQANATYHAQADAADENREIQLQQPPSTDLSTASGFIRGSSTRGEEVVFAGAHFSFTSGMESYEREKNEESGVAETQSQSGDKELITTEGLLGLSYEDDHAMDEGSKEVIVDPFSITEDDHAMDEGSKEVVVDPFDIAEDDHTVYGGSNGAIIDPLDIAEDDVEMR